MLLLEVGLLKELFILGYYCLCKIKKSLGVNLYGRRDYSGREVISVLLLFFLVILRCSQFFVLVLFLFDKSCSQIQTFNLFSGPGRLTQKFKARFDAWIFAETIDRNFCTQLIPPVALNQASKNHLQSDAMHWVIDMRRIFYHSRVGLSLIVLVCFVVIHEFLVVVRISCVNGEVKRDLLYFLKSAMA